MFWDREMTPAKGWEERIEQELHDATCVVVLWTPASRKSDWVIREATEALQTGRLVQLKCTALSEPPPFDAIESLQFLAWREEEEHPEKLRLITEVARRVDGPLPTLDAVRQLTLPARFGRFEVASAVFNYCS